MTVESPASSRTQRPLSHVAVGKGDPVLLLNGGMMTHQAWEPIASPLRSEYRVVGCDFRGQLLTPGKAPTNLDDHVEDVARLLQHLGLPPVHVVGTSFGGAVAVLLAARHPEKVRSLAAVTVSDHATEEMDAATREMREVVAEVVSGKARDRFQDLLEERVFSPDYRRLQAAQLKARRHGLTLLPKAWFKGLNGILAAIEGYDLRPDLSSIRCPTLIALSHGDEVMPPKQCQALAAGINGATLAEHPQSGHALVAEQPDWLRLILLDFFHRLQESSN